MKWENLEQSDNVEDLRSRGPARSGGSLRAILPIAQFLMKSKTGRVVLLIGVVAYFFGFNPLALLDQSSQPQQTAKSTTKEDKEARFVGAVLGQTEKVWSKLFAEHGLRYKDPKLVLFRGSVRSGCGYANAQTGPFYCPADQKVYLDLGFFDELKRRFHAPGDFAEAYVIAHEIGHHVQNQLGTLKKSHALQARSSKKTANKVQVRVELQADCYAGVWAHYLDGILEDGDIQEALGAASAIGDDTLQKETQGYVVPDSFTHGTSKQRASWFLRGYKTGKMEACNTGI